MKHTLHTFPREVTYHALWSTAGWISPVTSFILTSSNQLIQQVFIRHHLFEEKKYFFCKEKYKTLDIFDSLCDCNPE